jgi:hypothetical protein
MQEFLRLAVYVPVDEASIGPGTTVASAAAVQEIMRVLRAFDFAGSVGTYRTVAQISGCADTFTPTRWSKWTAFPCGCRESSRRRENGSRPPFRAGYDPSCSYREGGRSWTATTTPRRPFEPSSKRRRGFPLAKHASSGAIASSAPTPNSLRSSAATTRARAARAAAFRRCCRSAGRFDGVPSDYYVRDR